MDTPKIISRKDAKAAGLTRYFTGKPCPSGHVAERAAHNGECIDCKNAAKKAWRAKNPEKVRKQKIDGYYRNRESILERWKQKYAENPEPKKTRANEWRKANPEAHLKKNNAWRSANRDKDHAWGKQWRDKNKDKVRAGMAKRKAAKRRALPSWYSKEWDDFVLREAVRLCRQRERLFSFKWHIDHMIPLRAKTASGLHCADNLAVIPDQLNLKKQNRMIYTLPGSWLADA